MREGDKKGGGMAKGKKREGGKCRAPRRDLKSSMYAAVPKAPRWLPTKRISEKSPLSLNWLKAFPQTRKFLKLSPQFATATTMDPTTRAPR